MCGPGWGKDSKKGKKGIELVRRGEGRELEVEGGVSERLIRGGCIRYLEGCEVMELKELWSYKTGDAVVGLAFSTNGNLGAASADDYYYVFDPKGGLLNKKCGSWEMEDASFSNDKFGFVNDDNHVYITNEDGSLWKEIYVGYDYKETITMLPDGFIACQDRCAYFDFNGNMKWDMDVGWVDNGPSVYNGYVYVADIDDKKLLILKLSDGSKVNGIYYGEEARDTAVCGNYLAVVTNHHLYLYDLSDPANPREVWSVGGINDGWQAAFSPDCRYVAIADRDGRKLRIYDLQGNEVLKKSYGTSVTAIAWFRDRIAVGLYNGEIYVYKLDG